MIRGSVLTVCFRVQVHLSGTAIESAYDGVATVPSGGWYIAAAAADTIVLDIEIPGAPVPVCAARLTFSGKYPQRWRLKASRSATGALSTWVEAGATTGAATARQLADWQAAVASGPAWVISGDGQLDISLPCEEAGRIRLEMEDANDDGLYIRLLELELLTVDAATLGCNCRNGGVCVGNGGCTCPFDSGCSAPACGYAGDLCETPTCVPTINCNMQGLCSGPNTCDCSPGWHGLVGLEQCLATQCGDGELTHDEDCDDGNTQSGDGCDASCSLEQLPMGHSRVLSDEWAERWLPRSDINAPAVTEDTLAITLAVRTEQVRTVTDGVIVGGVPGVKFEQLTVNSDGRSFELRCDRVCHNGGTCVTMGFTDDFAPGCVCPEGFQDDERCGSDTCTIQCDHGGYCTSEAVCVDCGAG